MSGADIELDGPGKKDKKNKGKKDDSLPAAAALAVDAPGGGDLDKLREFYQKKWTDHPRAKVVPEGRSVFEVARGIQPELVAPPSAGGTFKKWIVEKTPVGRHVPYGHLSLGTGFGNPKIWAEGYYVRPGVGSKFGRLERLNTKVLHSQNRILTIINLKENEVAIVVNTTDTQVCYGPSQYVLLEPWSQAGEVVDLMQLQRTNYEFVYDGSIRALAFHVPKGEVAIIQVNDEKDSLRVFGSGHHVVSEGGARFVSFIDTRDTEMSRDCSVRIRSGNIITWPLTMSLQIINPVAFYTSKRKSALDVIDEALSQCVAQFCAKLDLNQIRGGSSSSEERSVYSVLAEEISGDANVNNLATKHGVVVKNVVIGTFRLDANAERAIEAAAKEELQMQNGLRQADTKIHSDEAEFRVAQKHREFQMAANAEEAKMRLERQKRSDDEADAAEQRKQARERDIREKQAQMRLMEADAEAQAKLRVAQAEVEAKRLELELIEQTRKVLGDEFMREKMKMEIRATAVEKTFSNTDKMIIDPRMGMRHVMGFLDDDPADGGGGGGGGSAAARAPPVRAPSEPRGLGVDMGGPPRSKLSPYRERPRSNAAQ